MAEVEGVEIAQAQQRQEVRGVVEQVKPLAYQQPLREQQTKAVAEVAVTVLVTAQQVVQA